MTRNVLVLTLAAILVAAIGGWVASLPKPTDSTAPVVAALPAGAYIDASGTVIQPTTAPTAPPATQQHPAPAIQPGWLTTTSAATAIPGRALQAYAQAAITTATGEPSCHLSWNTIAAIGDVESGNGTHGGAYIGTDGNLVGTILGPPLDGSDGTLAIRNTDPSLDGPGRWARAVGPLQFLPETWAEFGADGNGDGKSDPNNIDDAALTAARYLCANGHNLATPAGWTAAIRSYNDDTAYIAEVRDQADVYAQEVK